MKRRDFLRSGGALVVAFAWRPGDAQEETGGMKPVVKPELPGSLKKLPYLDGWIRIDESGHVTVFTGKAELGQGIKTALIQVAAEELMVRPASVSIVTADTERTADEGYTAGSHSMQDSGTAIKFMRPRKYARLAARRSRRKNSGSRADRAAEAPRQRMSSRPLRRGQRRLRHARYVDRHAACRGDTRRQRAARSRRRYHVCRHAAGRASTFLRR